MTIPKARTAAAPTAANAGGHTNAPGAQSHAQAHWHCAGTAAGELNSHVKARPAAANARSPAMTTSNGESMQWLEHALEHASPVVAHYPGTQLEPKRLRSLLSYVHIIYKQTPQDAMGKAGAGPGRAGPSGCWGGRSKLQKQ